MTPKTLTFEDKAIFVGAKPVKNEFVCFKGSALWHNLLVQPSRKPFAAAEDIFPNTINPHRPSDLLTVNTIGSNPEIAYQKALAQTIQWLQPWQFVEQWGFDCEAIEAPVNTLESPLKESDPNGEPDIVANGLLYYKLRTDPNFTPWSEKANFHTIKQMLCDSLTTTI